MVSNPRSPACETSTLLIRLPCPVTRVGLLAVGDGLLIVGTTNREIKAGGGRTLEVDAHTRVCVWGGGGVLVREGG